MLFSEYVEELRKIYKAYGVSWGVAPGCVESSLKEAETLVGFPLERGLRDAWLIADGSEHQVRMFSRPGYLTGYDFLSLASALKERKYAVHSPSVRRLRGGKASGSTHTSRLVS